MNATNETLTNDAVRKMIAGWLTGDDERDAKSFSRTFRMMRMTRDQWRQVIAETRAAAK